MVFIVESMSLLECHLRRGRNFFLELQGMEFLGTRLSFSSVLNDPWSLSFSLQ